MPVKIYKPFTQSRRGMQTTDYGSLTKGVEIPKSLLEEKSKTAGRNNQGVVTAKYRGGGNKKKYRLVDFYRRTEGPATVLAIHYDPNRSAFIALIRYESSGSLSYVLAPDGIREGDRIESGENVPIKVGNSLPLRRIADGTIIHNIEVHPGRRGKLVRSAGTWAQLLGKEGNRTIVRLPSGEVRYISSECYATIGRVSNVDHENVKLGKAGARRHQGRRPRTRPVHMNPVDHPMGGGEGKSKSGTPPVSEGGVPAKGYRTRKKSKPKSHIIKSRRQK